jgi:hypothetical protein
LFSKVKRKIYKFLSSVIAVLTICNYQSKVFHKSPVIGECSGIYPGNVARMGETGPTKIIHFSWIPSREETSFGVLRLDGKKILK